MNKVKPNFQVGKLKHPEELEYHFAIRTVVERLTPAALDAVKIAPFYKAAIDRFDNAVKVDRSSELSPSIRNCHDKLVRAMTGLSLAVAAVEHNLDTAKAAEGASLRRVLDRYKTNEHTNYEVTADNAHNLLDDLKAAKIAGYITKYNLNEWVSTITTVLTYYRQLVADRFDEIGALPTGEAKAARLACRHLGDTLFERINSQIFDGADVPAAVVSFAHSMKEIFNRYKIVASSPGGHHHDGDGDGGDGSGEGGGGDVIHPVDGEE